MQSAIVTGATGGLGTAVAELLSESGEWVTMLCGHTKLPKHLPRSFGVSFDMRDPDQAGKRMCGMFLGLNYPGGLDLVVNCAGIAHPTGSAWETHSRVAETVFAANTVSLFALLGWVVPLMLSNGKGLLVHIGSRCGSRPIPQLAAYCASKAAAAHIIRCLSLELEGTGVNAITISPGGMNTQMRRNLFGPQDAEAQMDPRYVAQWLWRVVAGEVVVPNGGELVVHADGAYIITRGRKCYAV